MKNSMLLFALLFIIFSCKDNRINYCQRNFFVEYSDKDTLNYIFKIGCPDNDTTYKYKFELNYWAGVLINKRYYSDFSLKGAVFYEKNKLYLIPSGTNDKILFLDFTYKIGDSVNCNFKQKEIIDQDSVWRKVSFKTRLVNKFYDRKRLDTVFQFQLENIGIMFDTDYLGMFLGLKKGLIGIYHGESDEIFSARGYIYSLKLSKGELK